MLAHVSIQCADLDASAAFYDGVLAPLGGQRIMEDDDSVGYGRPPTPNFWIGRHRTGEGFRETHIAFTAPDRGRGEGFL
jgi:catechol 2,3-dioxygenase-like lactoylglutathione lyase family enzyme